MLAWLTSTVGGALWSLPLLGQLLLLTLILLVTWYYVALERRKALLRAVHKDIVILTQPVVCYSPLMFLLPRNWFRWLLPYRAPDMYVVLHEIFTRTGARVVGFASPCHTEVFFNDEELIREFTIRQHEKFPKAYQDYEVLRFWGDNIVTAPSEGYEWKKHRALLTPAFSTGNLRLVANVTVANTNALFAKWDRQTRATATELGEVAEIRADDDTIRLMLYVIAGAGFGQNLGFDKPDEDYDRSKFSMSFTEAMGVVSRCLLMWIAFRPVFKLPIPQLQAVQRGFEAFEAHVKHMIASRSAELAINADKKASVDNKDNNDDNDNDSQEVRAQMEAAYDQAITKADEAEVQPEAASGGGGSGSGTAAGPARNDLLSLLLKARAADARISLTDEEVFSDSFIFLLAGHETTAHSMAWAFAFLAINPQEQDRLHEEVTAVLGLDRDPTYDDFDRLLYAQCAFKETLRLMPPVWALGKCCAEATSLIDHRLTPDIRATMAIYSLHRNPRYWKEPERFMPSRFDTRANPPVSPGVFIPFSVGRRSCLGNRFALVEATMFLAKVMQKYTIHVPTGTDLAQLFEGENVITVTPRHPMRLWLKKRPATQ